MLKRLFMTLMALALFIGTASSAWALLASLGEPIDPHGYPAYFEDVNGLQLELCVPPPAGTATAAATFCVFDGIDPATPLVVTGESFWWLATSRIDIPGGGRAELTLGVEATFGGNEAPTDGMQLSFGRTRIRIDTPSAGTYTVTHPYGTQEFVVTDPIAGINFTGDIGSVNFLDPAAGFDDTLFAFGPEQVPFLTWPDYQTNIDLQFFNGVQTEQYIGNPGTLSTVVGGTNGNIFRVQGPNGLDLQTDLFSVMGKVYDPAIARTAHVFPPPPEQRLAAIGPVNRLVDFGADGSVATIDPLFTDGAFPLEEDVNYPLGYPLWYEDFDGLRLAICQGVQIGTLTDLTPTPNLMCISDPIDTTAENYAEQLALRTGGETFYWSAGAEIVQGGIDAELGLGLEGTFGGDESLADGNQISFGRTRIRIDTTVAGDYTVIYPYGMKVYTGIDGADGAINDTLDLGMGNLNDPDHAFVGAVFSEIGPSFLTWDSFDPTLQNQDPFLIKTEPAYNPDGTPMLDALGEQIIRTVHYVGDPGILHAVKGGIFEYEGEPVNYFRVIGPNGLDLRTDLFAVSGRVNMDAVPATAITLSAEPIDEAAPGTLVTFTASASGGSGNYLYRFLVQGPTDPAPVLTRDYTTTATWEWDTTGLAAGIYQITVDARNIGSAADVEATTTIQYTLLEATPLNNDTLFVAQTYLDILNRAADQGGLDFWAGELTAGNVTRQQLVDMFLQSGEFAQNLAPVIRLYFTCYLRPPDYAGLMFWLDAYAAGMSLTQIADEFVTAPEFIAMYGALTNEEFVTLVYVNVLERQPDAEGLAHWTGLLEAGTMTRGEIMVAFSESAEYLSISASEIYATMCYIGLFLREPDQDGFTFWVSSLDLGVPGQEMVAQFLSSTEYTGRF